MIQSVNIIALLIGVFISITSDIPACHGQQAKLPKTAVQKVGRNKMQPRSFLVPLNEGSKEQVIAYYKKLPASVKAETVATENANLLCLAVDTGSGRAIISAFIYMMHGDKWTLLYHDYADGDYVDIKFAVKDQDSIQILGGFISTKKNQHKLIYRVIDTVFVKRNKS